VAFEVALGSVAFPSGVVSDKANLMVIIPTTEMLCEYEALDCMSTAGELPQSTFIGIDPNFSGSRRCQDENNYSHIFNESNLAVDIVWIVIDPHEPRWVDASSCVIWLGRYTG
jgi:hypothetical protein